jgi:hypothetical protein
LPFENVSGLGRQPLIQVDIQEGLAEISCEVCGPFGSVFEVPAGEDHRAIGIEYILLHVLQVILCGHLGWVVLVGQGASFRALGPENWTTGYARIP